MIPIKRFYLLFLLIPILLLIPLIGMQLSNEIKWSIFDFILMCLLLTVVVVTVELFLRFFKTKMKRIMFIGLILIVFFVIWAELAVGIFGTPFAGN